MWWDLHEKGARFAPTRTDGRLPLSVSILVIGGLSLLSWAALIEAVLALRNLF